MTKKSTKSGSSNKRGFSFILFLLCFLPFGFDKLYCHNTKVFLCKFLLHFIGIGFIWWLFDLVCVCLGSYKVNPLK